jgi:hypothetical protein
MSLQEDSIQITTSSHDASTANAGFEKSVVGLL